MTTMNNSGVTDTQWLVVGGIFLLDQSVVRGYKVIVLGGTFTLLLRIFWVRDTMFSCWDGPIIHLVNLLSISWVMSYCLGGGLQFVSIFGLELYISGTHARKITEMQINFTGIYLIKGSNYEEYCRCIKIETWLVCMENFKLCSYNNVQKKTY